MLCCVKLLVFIVLFVVLRILCSCSSVVIPGDSADQQNKYNPLALWFTYAILPPSAGIRRFLAVNFKNTGDALDPNKPIQELIDFQPSFTATHWIQPITAMEHYGREIIRLCPDGMRFPLMNYSRRVPNGLLPRLFWQGPQLITEHLATPPPPKICNMATPPPLNTMTVECITSSLHFLQHCLSVFNSISVNLIRSPPPNTMASCQPPRPVECITSICSLALLHVCVSLFITEII